MNSLFLGALFLPLCSALNLNITAISAKDGASILECWQLASPLSISKQAGTAGSAITQLGDLANASLSVLPAGFDGGLHNAPANQYVVFLSGLAYVTLPEHPNATGAYVSGGEFGVIFAADTAAVSRLGHRTVYPGITETVALQIPTEGGALPNHTVVHHGPCVAADTLGLRGLVVPET